MNSPDLERGFGVSELPRVNELSAVSAPFFLEDVSAGVWPMGVPVHHQEHVACSAPRFQVGSGLVGFSRSTTGWYGSIALGAQVYLKRVVDVVGAAICLLIIAPAMLVVAALIKMDSRGPVIFRQVRTGYGNKPFTILKFRTMRADQCDLTGVTQTVSGDERVTRVGRVLRQTNLDELPQLFNVLCGDMSLVGPRPHVPGMRACGVLYEQLAPRYQHRHLMRPGITGLAQVHGLRGPTIDLEPSLRRIEKDLEYIQNFSLWLDAKILLQTLIVESRGGTGF